MKKSFISIAATISLTTILAACGESVSERQYNDSVKLEKIKAESKTPQEEPGVMVGGAKLVKSKNLFDNAESSADHKTFVGAIRAAQYGGILYGSGPFTVFAPTDSAFAKLPKGTLENLLKAENKAELTKLVTYHIMQGAITINDVKDGQKLKMIQGEEITVLKKDDKMMIKDAKGNVATVTIPNVVSSNGVIFVIDGVLRP